MIIEAEKGYFGLESGKVSSLLPLGASPLLWTLSR